MEDLIDIPTVNLKKLRAIWTKNFVVIIFTTALVFVIRLLFPFEFYNLALRLLFITKNFTYIFLFLGIIASIIRSNRVPDIKKIDDIHEKIKAYEKNFLFNMQWAFIMIATNAIQYLLIGSNIIIYIHIFFIFLFLIQYPKKRFFNKLFEGYDIHYIE